MLHDEFWNVGCDLQVEVAGNSSSGGEALRFGADGEVRPVFPGAAEARAGFAFVLRPTESPSLAADRRALFVSFPTGIVKTAAF